MTISFSSVPREKTIADYENNESFWSRIFNVSVVSTSTLTATSLYLFRSAIQSTLSNLANLETLRNPFERVPRSGYVVLALSSISCAVTCFSGSRAEQAKSEITRLQQAFQTEYQQSLIQSGAQHMNNLAARKVPAPPTNKRPRSSSLPTTTQRYVPVAVRNRKISSLNDND